VITNAAREGARILVLPAFTPADAQARVNQYLEAAGLDPDEATVPLPAAAAPEVLPSGTCIETRTVTLSYPHEAPFLSGIGSYFGGTFGTFTLNASSTMRSESAAGVCPPPPPAP